jgi:hypothetical protein
MDPGFLKGAEIILLVEWEKGGFLFDRRRADFEGFYVAWRLNTTARFASGDFH